MWIGEFRKMSLPMPNFLILAESHDYIDGKPHEQRSLPLCSSRVPLHYIRATRLLRLMGFG